MLSTRVKSRNLKNVYGNVLWYLYFYANCNAHTQILRTVKDFAERFTFLPAFESNVPFLGAMSHILGRKFWWLGYPCYDGPIAKAMD